jgi:hypothetical protein
MVHLSAKRSVIASRDPVELLKAAAAAAATTAGATSGGVLEQLTAATSFQQWAQSWS